MDGLTAFFPPSKYAATQMGMTNSTVTLNILKDNALLASNIVFDLGANKQQIFDNNKLCVELLSIDTISPINKTEFAFKYYDPASAPIDYTLPVLGGIGALVLLYFIFRR